MSDRKVFADSVTPLPPQAGLTANGLMINAAPPEQRDEMRTLLFALAIPPAAQKELEDKVARGEVVPAKELQTGYSPSAADIDALVAWLKAQGFEVTQVSPDGTSVYARASIEQIERSL